MSNLASSLSEDSRQPIERLRRPQLWKVAQAYDVSFPKDATAKVMVEILKAAEIDVSRPLPDGSRVLEMVPVQMEDGSVRMEPAPVEKPHATQGKNIDYDGIIEAQAAENAELKTENASVAEQLAAIMGKLDTLSAENAELKSRNEELTSSAKVAKPHNKLGLKAKPKTGSNGQDLT